MNQQTVNKGGVQYGSNVALKHELSSQIEIHTPNPNHTSSRVAVCI